MLEKFAGALPGFVLSLLVSTITSVVLFSGNFAKLESRVEFNQAQIQKFVPREEHQQVKEWQAKYEGLIEKRLDSVERKIDQLIIMERGK